MNKSELVALAAQRTGLPKKDATLLLNAALDAVSDALAGGERVQLSGFGVFYVKRREARVGRNPRTKEQVLIPATNIPMFKPSQALRDLIETEGE